MKKPHFLLALVLFLVYLVFLTIKPLITAVLSSFVLTFVFHPIFLRINKRISNKNISSALTLIVILLIIIIPSLILTNSLAQESLQVYQKVRTQDLSSFISKYFDSGFQEQISGVVNNALLFIIKSTSNFLLSIPQLALNFFVTIFITYYLLKDAPELITYLKKILPSFEKGQTLMLEKFRTITKALIFGTLLTALIQGILGGIGFAIFGISSPVLWGSIMAVTSIIPLLGTAIVWLPAGLIQLFQGDYVSGIGILIFGGVIVSTADNFIKPKLVGRRANIHPVIVLLGILGGLQLLGFVGLIAGPLILAMSLELLKLKKF
jgi:predicted PurR-regulated permease PerM